MKESDAYKLAQSSVLHDQRLTDSYKLRILRILMDREELAEFKERELEE